MPLWLVLLCALAFFWDRQTAIRPDPFLASRASLPYLIAITMLAIGSLLPREELFGVFRRWPLVLFGTAVQYLSMPTLAFVVARLWGIEGPWLIGCLMVGCVPGAMASNVLTLVARGNVSYSVSLTTSATLLSPLVVPLAMWLTVGQFAEFPVIKTGVDLLWMVVLPVACGYLLSQGFALWRKLSEVLGPLLANLVILWIIAVVVATNRGQLQHISLFLVSALLTINAGGYAAGYLAGRVIGLPVGMCRALTLEIGMQNAGLGTTLVLGLFPNQPEAAIPCALYTFGCMFTGTLLARGFAMCPFPADQAPLRLAENEQTAPNRPSAATANSKLPDVVGSQTDSQTDGAALR